MEAEREEWCVTRMALETKVKFVEEQAKKLTDAAMSRKRMSLNVSSSVRSMVTVRNMLLKVILKRSLRRAYRWSMLRWQEYV